MNIFFVDKDPQKAAIALVDKHVVKMILETAQMLSTAHRVLDGIEETVDGKKVLVFHDERELWLYKTTHINHPSAKWVRESVENYNWAFDHLIALCHEFTHRYKKHHKVYGYMTSMLSAPPHNLKNWDMTPIPCAMPEEYIISNDPVVNYRNYYIHGKNNLFKWKDRKPPEWIHSEV